MRERPYRLGLVLGRFQGLHIGHEAVIRKALSVCDRVIVMSFAIVTPEEAEGWQPRVKHFRG